MCNRLWCVFVTIVLNSHLYSLMTWWKFSSCCSFSVHLECLCRIQEILILKNSKWILCGFCTLRKMCCMQLNLAFQTWSRRYAVFLAGLSVEWYYSVQLEKKFRAIPLCVKHSFQYFWRHLLLWTPLLSFGLHTWNSLALEQEDCYREVLISKKMASLDS